MRSLRVSYPIPVAGIDPWYDSFVDLIGAIDLSVYAEREDRMTMLQEGGTLTYVNGLLTWSADIKIPNPIVAYFWIIEANPAPGITLQDGEYFYVTLVRHQTRDIVLEPKTGFTVPNTDDDYVVCQRRSDRIYFINGKVLQNGQSLPILSTSGSSSPSSGGQTASARFTNVMIGPQGPVKFDVGVATNDFIQASLAIRIDKAVTAGTITVRIGNQSGPISSLALTPATNGGLFVTVSGLATAMTLGDLITLEFQTDPLYNHNTGGFAAINVSASLS